EVAFAAERFLRALPFGKRVVVVEDESLVMEEVDHQAKIVGGGEPRPLAPAGIEVLVASVERQRKETLRAPLETVPAPVAHLDRRAAVAREHVDHFLEHVPLRRALCARREIEDEDRDEVAAALQVCNGTLDAEARPRRRWDLNEVDAEI